METEPTIEFYQEYEQYKVGRFTNIPAIYQSCLANVSVEVFKTDVPDVLRYNLRIGNDRRYITIPMVESAVQPNFDAFVLAAKSFQSGVFFGEQNTRESIERAFREIRSVWNLIKGTFKS